MKLSHALVLSGFCIAGAAYAPVAHAQNTWQRPYAANSIWNTPIGANPSYVPCNLGTLGAMANDRENLIVCNAADPFWYAERPDGLTDNPAGNLPYAYTSPAEANGGAALLQTDGLTIQQFNYWTRDPAGSKPTGWYFGADQLNGDGIHGGHGGSSMSVLGGAIRKGELESASPLNHALKLELDWAVLFHSTVDPLNEAQTYRWPASNSDGNFGGTGGGPLDGYGRSYGGSNPALKMGSLLAIPRNVNLNNLGLSAYGLKIAQALQNYGAYIVDTTGDYWQWGNGGYTMSICIEKGATTNYLRASNDYINNDTLYHDMAAIYNLLAVIDDNGPNSIGGGNAKTTFLTGFESGDPQPDWTDTPDNDLWSPSTNPTNVSGYYSWISPECGVRTGEEAHTGNSALMYSGTANGGNATYLYYKVFDFSGSQLPITSASTISYWIYPQQDNGRYVAVDFHCTDGSTLRDSGIKDSNGFSVHPNAGHGGNIPINGWTQVFASLGSLAGKQIDRVWVAYDHPGSTGQYRGYIDDLRIEPPLLVLPSAPTGIATSAGNAQVTLSWTAPAGTIASYKLFRSTTKGGEGTIPYKTGITTTTYTDTGLTNGTVYYYRIEAVSSAGNGALSAEVSATPQATVTKVNDNYTKIAYSGTWTVSSNTGYFNGDMHYSTVTGSSASFSFTGTTIYWIGGKNTDHGIASVSIDGGAATLVDTYSATWLKQQALFTRSGLTAGAHTIKVTVGATKNSASTGYTQDIDAFKYQ